MSNYIQVEYKNGSRKQKNNKIEIDLLFLIKKYFT